MVATVPAERKSSIKPRETLEVFQQCPALLDREASQLTDKQKAVADARSALAQEVLKLHGQAGLSRNAAVNYIVDGSRTGTLPGLGAYQSFRWPAWKTAVEFILVTIFTVKGPDYSGLFLFKSITPPLQNFQPVQKLTLI